MDRRFFLCITALCLATFTTATDEDSKETENIDCKQDGFLPHPTNCRAYYWCSLRRRVRAIILECEQDEIFDTQSQKCTYPNLSTRKECGGTKIPIDASGIAARNVRSPAAQLRNQPNGCSKEEFVGDDNDCSKFYRCVNNGGGQFAKYEFSCAPGTVWDSDISSCNHPWAVKSKCGHGLVNSPPKGEYEQSPIAEQPYPIKNPDPYPMYPQQLPQGMQNPDYGTYNPNPYPPQSQGYPEYPQYPQYPGPEEGNDNPNPINENRPQGGYVPLNGYNPQQQQNQEKPSLPSTSPEPQQPSSPDKTTEVSSSTPPVIDNEINSGSSECQAEGFLPDSQDCKKFYRCVENGKRRFIKYEFSCGQGTVWDPQINACNHEWAVKKNNCKYKVDNEAGENPSTSGNQTIEETDGNKDEKHPIGEGGSTSQENSSTSSTNENSSSTSTDGQSSSTSSSEQNISSSSEANQSTDGEKEPQEISYECNKEGFIPDRNDCKKFYRCVQNEKRGFVKYEFSCGQGTVWDPDANTCNFPWATRNKCGKGTESSSGNSTQPIGNESSTEKEPVQIDSSNSATTEQGSSESNENGSSNNSTTSENIPGNTDNTESNSTQEFKGDCTSEEDYISDKNDCKKFYRCVKSSKKGFTKYEFSCGQGTVWDPDAKTCNYPWATRSKCGTGQESASSSSAKPPIGNESGISTSEASTSVTENKDETTEKGSTSSQSTITEERNNSTDQISNMTSSNAQYDNCVADGGFIGDSKDCKKFYRCIANENGGFTKYEFTCGEGTVWDTMLNTCNYPWAVKGSCKTKGVDSGETSTSEAQNGTSTEEKENVLTTEQPEITTVLVETSSLETGNMETQSEVSSPQPSSTQSSPVTEYSTITIASSSESTTDSSEQSSTTESESKETSSQQPSTINSSEQSPATDSSTESSSSEAGNKETSTQQPSTSDSSDQSPTTETSSNQSPTTETSTASNNNAITEQTDKVTSTESTPADQEKMNKCTKEGFFPNIGNCNKFYRCVSNGQGGYTKYEFDCGGGTIWDPDLDTCNYPYAVKNKICEQGNQQEQQPKGDCTTEGYFASNQDCKNFFRCVGNGKGQYVKYEFKCSNNTIWDPNTLSCNYPWATVNKACGHRGDNIPPTPTPENETKTEPPKEITSVTPSTTEMLNNTTEQEVVTTVSNKQTTIDVTTESQTEVIETSPQPSTTEKSTTQDHSGITTEQELTTSEKSESSGTTESSSESTGSSSESTDSSSSTETASTDSSSTETASTDSSSTDSSSTETASTDSSSTDSSSIGTASTDSSSSTETASTDSTSSTEITSTDSSSSSEITSTDSSSSTEITSIDSSSSTEITSIDSSSSTEITSTDSSSSSEITSTDSSSSTEIPSTESSSSTETGSSSTETTSTDSSSSETASIDSLSTESTSTDSTESASTDPSSTITSPPQEANQTTMCPISQLEGDQMALVCPTGFKRHPKYCNLFYQCTSNPDTFDINVLVISCPGRRIYDDSMIQCLPEEESDQECEGQMAEKEQLRKFGKSVQPMEMEIEEPLCPNEGNFPLHPTECSNHFIKCKKSSSRSMRGFMYQCPEDYSYWPVSKKCEKLGPALPCEANEAQENMWQIPVDIEIDPGSEINVRMGEISIVI